MVVHGDVATLQLGREVPHSGASVVVFDLFDAGGGRWEWWQGVVGRRRVWGGSVRPQHAHCPPLCAACAQATARPMPPPPAGLLGNRVLQLLRAVAAARLAQPCADVIPSRARVFAVGLHVATGEVAGFDLGPADKHR
jgi:hypothetical protein